MKKRERGSALLELALVFPMLTMLLVGVVDFGRLFHMATTVSGAAKAGAQYGAIGPAQAVDGPGIQAAALADASGISGVTVTSRRYCQCGNGEEVACGTACIGAPAHRVYVSVTAQRPFATMFRYPGIPANTNLTSRVTMRVQ